MNKYQYEINQAWNRFLDFYIHASFHGVNRLFVLSFKDKNSWKCYKQYYFANLEKKDFNVMINGINFFANENEKWKMRNEKWFKHIW